MLPKINKILYATDLSDNSAYALRYALNSAIKHDAGITILHVFELISTTNRFALELYIDGDLRKKKFNEKVADTIDRIRKRLKIFCDKEFDGDAKYADRVASIEVCEGFPADEILKKADDFSCDAIVMGTHGKGSITHAFLGSTTKRVLHRMRVELSIFLKKEIKLHPDYPDLVEHLLVYPGKVAEEIVEKANRFSCEAIVLGSRGTSGLKRLFRCGTAKKVLSQTQKPVFLVSMKHGKINISSYNLTRTSQD